MGIVENTLSAITAAMDAGYAIELDVQLSGDGEAVIFHDFTLERLTTGNGILRDHTVAGLKQIAFRHTADRIMTLPELLALVNGRVPLLIEMKSAFDGDTRVAQRAAELVSRYQGAVALMSFDPDLVAAVRRANSGIVRGIVAERHYAHDEWALLPLRTRLVLTNLLHWPRTRFEFIAYRAADLGNARLRVARVMGLPVLAWTVRSAEDQARAVNYADQMIFEGFRP